MSPPAFATLAYFASCFSAVGEIGQRELGVDHLDVGDRIDLARDVDHVRVVEAAHDVHDGVGLADVRQELVAEPLALGGAGDQAGDVDELDRRRDELLRLLDRREPAEPRVGHLDDADVGLDGAERIILGRDAGLGQRIEQRGLAHVRQADDPATQAHGAFLLLLAEQGTEQAFAFLARCLLGLRFRLQLRL